MTQVIYEYDEAQVCVYSQGVTTLTDLERTLLNRVDELTLTIEELQGNA